MTNRHRERGVLRPWRVERAPGTPEITEAGRIAVPVRLRRIGAHLRVADTVLVMTADEAEALCSELAVLMQPSGPEAS